MKTFRKTLSLLLALVICLSAVPFAVSASDDFHIDGAWTYTVENNKATVYFGDNTVIGDVTIPSKLGGYTVTTIADYALRNRSEITSVTIPNSVTTIGDEAFKSSSITTVNLGKGVTSIGAQAFAFCKNLKTLTIPDSVKSIGAEAFSNCTGLTKVSMGSGVTTIEMSTFNSCTSLKDLTIGSKVTTIGSSAFSYCYALTSVTLPASVTTIEDYAFRGCNELIAITFDENIKTIKAGAFSGCSSLTDVYFKGTTKQWNAISLGSYNTSLTNANIHKLGDSIIPVIPSQPSNPSNPDTPDNPGSSDNGDSNPVECTCKCHSKGFKKFIFKIMLFFQKIFRKNQSCACGALHYIIL